MQRWKMQVVFLLTLLMAALAVPRSFASAGNSGGDELICASTRDHLWFVMDNRHELTLCHHAAALNGPYFRAQSKLTTKPSALAAWGDRVWLVFPPAPGSLEPRRETFTLQVNFDEALDLYSVTPSGRLDAVASLPGLGDLAAFVGSEHGPVALLLPPQHAVATVTAGQRSQAAEPVLVHPRLLQLRGSKWVELALPESIGDSLGNIRLVSGADRTALVLLASSDLFSGRTIVYTRNSAEGTWSKTECAQELRDVEGLVSAGNQIIAAIHDPLNRSLMISSLRPTRMLPLARLPVPAGSFALSGLADRIQLLEKVQGPAITISVIEPVSGAVSTRVTLIDQPIGYRLWQMGLLVVVLGASILLVFLVRPTPAGAVSLQSGLMVAGLGMRMAALAIDLVPGVLVTIILFKFRPEDLIYPPVLTTNLMLSIPYSMVALFTAMHCAATEVASGTTLGKFLVGAKVVRMDGSRPRRLSLLIRNLVKLLVMLVPPLALIVFFNPHMQGMADLIARTVVVHPGEATEPEERSPG